MQRLIVDAHHPDSAVIQRAAHLLHDGKLGAIPTDTLYGLAVDPFNAAAVARVFEIKERDASKALLIVAADALQVWDWIGEMTPLGLRLAERFWPGPLTLVTRAPVALPPGVADHRHTVGVRVPAHAVTRALCEACGRPLTATSANISGQPATADPAVVVRQLGQRLDLIVDAGVTPGGAASTVVDVTGGTPTLIREGAIAWAKIQQCLHE
jgi:tRNA threonylcarbamoyl adenosine modification protein (Sua5/YciO/YrdC/YwlC family)